MLFQFRPNNATSKYKLISQGDPGVFVARTDCATRYHSACLHHSTCYYRPCNIHSFTCSVCFLNKSPQCRWTFYPCTSKLISMHNCSLLCFFQVHCNLSPTESTIRQHNWKGQADFHHNLDSSGTSVLTNGRTHSGSKDSYDAKHQRW